MKKLIPWVIIIVMVLFLGVGGYLIIYKRDAGVSGQDDDGLEGLRPREMRIVEADSDSFTVVWKTRKNTVGYVKYGDTSSEISLISQDKQGAELLRDHEVTVRNLIPGRKYYFWVISDEVAFGREGKALEVLTLSSE